MHMMMKKRHCKLVALFLLIVFLIPFVPVVPVSADPLSVHVPDFPYNQDSFYNVNNGGFALWQVHGSNYISYVQTFSSGAVGNPDPIVIYNRSFWADKSTYYLDVNYITDTWDIYGNHIDGWPGSNTSNIRLPYPFHDTVDSDVYATLVYCSDDVRWRNGSDTGIYMYMNYMVPGYADPTPTPTPEPEIDKKFPTFINAYATSYSGSETRYSNKYLVVNRYYDEINTRYEYKFFVVPYRESRGVDWKWKEDITPRYDNYDFIDNIFTAYFSNINPDHNYGIRYGGGFFTSSNYKTETEIYDLKGYVSSNSGSKMTETTNRNYHFSVSEPSMNYEATAVYTIAPDGSTTRVDGDGGSTPIATPTPTSAPTPIPQPSISPAPTEPPDDGDDGNWTGLFGWLKKLVNAIISIPVKIVNGLLSALKYIFIPDIGKIKALFNTLNDKFGINVPGTFEFDPVLLKNPENVVMHFKPISLNGEPTETTDITIIDFDKVDSWLESTPGQIIIRIIQAVYMLTMWGYMIYIFRKHIATVNYTDADTLEHSKYWES